MFFPRNLFALGLLVLFIALAAGASPPITNNEILLQSEPRVLGLILDILIKAFSWAAKNCIEEAAAKCGSDWWNIEKLIKCAGDYLAENKGRCLISG